MSVPAGPASSPLNCLVAGDGQRWKALLRNCVRPRNHGATVKLWGPGPEHKRMLTRHRLNNRRLDSVVKKYVEGLLKNGILEEMRGTIVLVEIPDHEGEYWIIGGATLIDAVYVAFSVQAENPNIKAIHEEGITGCIIFSNDTPEADLKWIKVKHNSLHSGQSETLAEIYKGVFEADQAWTAHRLEQDISTSSCPKHGPFRYEKQMEDFVLRTFKEYWAKYEHYDNTKSVWNALRDFTMQEKWVDLLERKADFMQPGFDNVWAIHHAHHLKVTILHKDFKNTIDNKVLGLIFFEALKMTVPWEGDSDSWILNQKMSDARIESFKQEFGPEKVKGVTRQNNKNKNAWARAQRAARTRGRSDHELPKDVVARLGPVLTKSQQGHRGGQCWRRR